MPQYQVLAPAKYKTQRWNNIQKTQQILQTLAVPVSWSQGRPCPACAGRLSASVGVSVALAPAEQGLNLIIEKTGARAPRLAVGWSCASNRVHVLAEMYMLVFSKVCYCVCSLMPGLLWPAAVKVQGFPELWQGYHCCSVFAKRCSV